MMMMDEEEDDEQFGIDPQQLFETYQAANSEEEYANMLMRNLEQNIDDEDLTTDGNDDGKAAPEPDYKYAGYMAPTMASVLPPYLCGEVERVRNSYRTGSYNSIKKLPTSLQAGQIRQTRKQHITENLLINSNNVFKPTSVLKNEPFHKPEYVGTDFDKMKNLHKYWLDEEKVQTDSLSRKPFVIQSRIRSKTEDIFHDPEYRFPGMGPGTGLKKLENMVRDNSEDDKIILEPGYILESKLNVASGLQVKEWTQKIHAKLVKDWSQYKFRVKFTKSNELVIQFQKPISNPTPAGDANNKTTAAPLNVIFPPPNNTLNKYMHNLATHGLASAFGLKKRGDRWNIMEVEYVNSNGSKDGTIPTYGTEPVSPYKNSSPSLRKSQSTNALTPSGGRTPGGRTPHGAGSVGGDDKHKSVRWFTRSSTDASLDSHVSGGAHAEVALSRSASASPTHGNLHYNELQQDPTVSPSPPPIAGNSFGQPGSTGVTPRSGTTPRSVTFVSDGIAAADSVSSHPLTQPLPSRASPVLGGSTSPISSGAGSIASSGSRGNSPEDPQQMNSTGLRDTHASYDHMRPPRIATYQDQPLPAEAVEQYTVTDKLYYLTYSFYAPWIHTGHMNVRRAMGYHNRQKAKVFGEKYHEKYSGEPRPRSNTEDSVESNNDVHYTNSHSTAPHPLPTNYTHGMYDSFRSDMVGSTGPSTPHLAAGRFMTGMMRDQRYNS